MGANIKLKINYEYIYLTLFIIIMLWIGAGQIFEHKIIHDFPHGDFASDAFQHIPRVDYIKEKGNYYLTPFYESAGYTDVVATYPPAFFYFSAIHSLSAGIPSYDSIFLMTVIMEILGCLFAYLLIRQFSKPVAILSLPLMILIFCWPFKQALLFGSRPFLITNLFVIGVFWAFSNIRLKYSFIFLAFFTAATLMSHAIEFFYVVAAYFLLIPLVFILKKTDKRDLTNMIISLPLAIAMTLVFFIVFLFTYVIADIKTGHSGFFPKGFFKFVGLLDLKHKVVSYPVLFQDFTIIFTIILIGAVIAMIYLIHQSFSKKEYSYAFILGFFGIVAGSLNFIGSRKSFQSRYFYPVYLAVFFGLALFFTFSQIKKYLNFRWRKEYWYVIGILLMAGFVFAYHEKSEYPSAIDPYHWQSFSWITENTPEDSLIYFFYADIYDQDAILRNSHRFHFQVVPQFYADAYNNQTIPRIFRTERPGEGTSRFPYRTGLFEFKRHTGELNPETKFPDKISMQDICQFDYYVFDIIPGSSRNPGLIQYNQIIRNVFLNNGMNEVYNNELISIIRNDIKGEDCVKINQTAKNESINE